MHVFQRAAARPHQSLRQGAEQRAVRRRDPAVQHLGPGVRDDRARAIDHSRIHQAGDPLIGYAHDGFADVAQMQGSGVRIVAGAVIEQQIVLDGLRNMLQRYRAGLRQPFIDDAIALLQNDQRRDHSQDDEQRTDENDQLDAQRQRIEPAADAFGVCGAGRMHETVHLLKLTMRSQTRS